VIVVAKNLLPMASGRVYLGEPSHHLRLGWNRRAQLVEDRDRAYSNRTVNLLFDSVADRGAGRSIDVILSGPLDDGASGLCAIKASGGLVMTVLPSTQVEGGMARSAAARLENIDFVGSPEEIGFEIERIVHAHPYASFRSDTKSVVDFHPR
jgi:chemotaxis response regulator CheB